MEDEKTIELSSPVLDLTGQPLTSFTVREPTAEEWEKFDSLPAVTANIRAVSLCSGVPEKIVRKFPASKLAEAANWIGGFLTVAPKTGDAV